MSELGEEEELFLEDVDWAVNAWGSDRGVSSIEMKILGYLEKSMGKQKLMERLRERISMGQAQYGKLDLENDTRDFEKEMQDELLDAVVYDWCKRRREELKR